MKYEFLQPYAIHEIGQRENQEDSIFPDKEQVTANDRLFVLCDGMGGHQSGEIASQTVCREVSRYITENAKPGEPFTDEDLSKAMQQAYDALDALDATESERKMGTTFVLLYFHAGGLMAAHLGDSRYYHIRPQTNEIIYRSRDHSVGSFRFEAGEISFEELKTMKGKNVILRALLPHQDERDMPDIVHIKDIKPDDWFFMCSDGMLENMSDKELLNVLCNKDLSDEQKYNWLQTSTDDNQDNHSAYMIHISGVMNELVDAGQPDDEQVARSRNRTFLAEMGYQSSTEESAPSAPAEEESADTEVTVEPMTIEVMPEDTDTNIVPPVMGKKAPAKRKMLWQWILVAILALAVCAAIVMLFMPSPPQDNKKKDDPRIEYIDRSNQIIDSYGTVSRGGDVEEEEDEFEEVDDIDIDVSGPTKSTKTKPVTTKPGTASKTTVKTTDADKIREAVHQANPTESTTSEPQPGSSVDNKGQGQSGESTVPGGPEAPNKKGKIMRDIQNKMNNGGEKSGGTIEKTAPPVTTEATGTDKG